MPRSAICGSSRPWGDRRGRPSRGLPATVRPVKMRDYRATEVALDHAEGHLTRREALQRLGSLGLSAVAATGLLAACGSEPHRRRRRRPLLRLPRRRPRTTTSRRRWRARRRSRSRAAPVSCRAPSPRRRAPRAERSSSSTRTGASPTTFGPSLDVLRATATRRSPRTCCPAWAAPPACRTPRPRWARSPRPTWSSELAAAVPFYARATTGGAAREIYQRMLAWFGANLA
jgi:hypothetical protein